MAHQCVHCKRILPEATKELFEGCASCGGKFFFYIRDEQMQKLKEQPVIEIPQEKKAEVEQDIREMAGIVDEAAPVILDIESVRVTGEGKFEIDIANVFKKNRPLIYKMEEGKYIIDLASTLKQGVGDIGVKSGGVLRENVFGDDEGEDKKESGEKEEEEENGEEKEEGDGEEGDVGEEE